MPPAGLAQTSNAAQARERPRWCNVAREWFGQLSGSQTGPVIRDRKWPHKHKPQQLGDIFLRTLCAINVGSFWVPGTGPQIILRPDRFEIFCVGIVSPMSHLGCHQHCATVLAHGDYVGGNRQHRNTTQDLTPANSCRAICSTESTTAHVVAACLACVKRHSRNVLVKLESPEAPVATVEQRCISK